MVRSIILSFLMLLIGIVHANEPNYVQVSAQTLDIANQKILAIGFENEKKWHTYWKNPGDSGQAIKVEFFKDGQKVSLKDYPWPAPKRYIEQGGIWAYGYEGRYALFFNVPENFKKSQIEIKIGWLVCKDICIPGHKIISTTFDENLNTSFNPRFENSELEAIFEKLPLRGEKSEINFFLQKSDKANELILVYMIEGADFSQISDNHNIVYPYLSFPFDYKHEEVFRDLENNIIYGRFYIDWDGVYEEPVWDLPEDGIFKKAIQTQFLVRYPKDEKVIISKDFTQFSTTGGEQLSKTLKTLSDQKQAKILNEEHSLFTYILFAFLGGLILNLMPCVLPVISLKLFGLIIHSDESKRNILRHNLFYTFGVLSSFVVLATVVYALKVSGEKIGWGFQLQSPLFVFFMLFVIFIMALNMLGLFEFITPGGKKLGNTQIKKSMTGDFINGVLATILSTPCSAPFLGSALPFAFTTTTLNIYIIFLSVGLGLAAPFIITGIFPALIRFFPRPGLWMDKLKRILGLTLILTAVWLYDILGNLIDLPTFGIYFNTLLTLIFFAFYFRKNISKHKILNLFVFALPILLFINLYQMQAFKVVDHTTSNQKSLLWSPWSKSKMEAAKKSQKYTFINFTAAWCLTCKVNKKLVLNSSDFMKVVKDNDIQLLEGDWTKRDDEITDFLTEYKIIGVPAYFLIKPDGSVLSMGETITVNKLKEQLK